MKYRCLIFRFRLSLRPIGALMHTVNSALQFWSEGNSTTVNFDVKADLFLSLSGDASLESDTYQVEERDNELLLPYRWVNGHTSYAQGQACNIDVNLFAWGFLFLLLFLTMPRQ